VVVDTDVISYSFKRDSRSSLYDSHLRGVHAIVSFMTVAELYLWPASGGWGDRRRANLESRIRSFTVQRCSTDLCRLWADAVAGASGAGKPIECGDAWIAATALLWDVPLITHNGRHYKGVDGLTVICEAST
jgi:predicted nucleic acid-binding protein